MFGIFTVGLFFLKVIATTSMQGEIGIDYCFPYNPYQINGTRAPNTTVCPDSCSCRYCRKSYGHSLLFRHRVDCDKKSNNHIPTASIPVDVMVLSMIQNHIAKMSNKSLAPFTQLEQLFLDYNILQSPIIDDHVFDAQVNLKILHMDYNRGLVNIPKAWFSNLVSLEYIYIRHSVVKTLEKGLFENCTQLKSVYLSGNQITKLPVDLFHNLPSLTNIDVKSNDIGQLHSELFLDSPNIMRFFVQNNTLTTISENVGLQNLINLTMLGVVFNPFVCDCDLVWFRNWINQTNATLVELEHAKCKKQNIGLVSFDANSLRCYSITIIVVICTCSSVTFLVVVSILLYTFRWDIRYWNQRRLLRIQYKRLEDEGPPPIDGVQIRYDAFISYNSKDVDWVLKSVLPTLEGPEFNFRLCVDFRDFVVGEAIADNISNAIKYSRKMLIVVTKNFVKSEWCYFEMEMARTRMFENHEDIFVVVILEHVASRKIPTLLQKILRKKTYIEWTDNPDGQKVFWTRLAAALNTPNVHRDRLIT
ncbi:toll-like receptor 13 [Anneissia japonica]|uniref:toll-like receptor 13 n=1 Tax=Anneissia japonica TaxID=1529436 RepID=UPI0014257944|nr:toll-like receptor 13 [Anneissia japonica]